MPPTVDELSAIKQYVLNPDDAGAHLRGMAERMAEDDGALARAPLADREEIRRECLDRAAEAIAAFIHLAWGGAGRAEYARRSYEMLCALRDRMRGMDPQATWQYAVDALNVDIQARLRRADHFFLDAEGEKELVNHFFDHLHEYDYLHDVAEGIKRLHWERRHSPESPDPACDADGRTAVLRGPRGDRKIEKHLERAATEALATYIEQANIVRGMVENPTDTAVVLRDRVNIQRELAAVNEHTWRESGGRLADAIESRFGTRAGRREARLARARWKALARRHAAEAG